MLIPSSLWHTIGDAMLNQLLAIHQDGLFKGTWAEGAIELNSQWQTVVVTTNKSSFNLL